MSKRTWFVVAAAVLVAAVVAALIFLNSTGDKWRPDQENWPPAQTMDDPELDDMPAEMRPRPQKDVLWSAYRPTFKGEIDAAGDRGDCASLTRYFDEATSTDTQDRLALTYVDRWGTHLRCREFTEEPAGPVPGPPAPFGLCEPEGKIGKTEGGTRVICKKDAQGTLRWVKKT